MIESVIKRLLIAVVVAGVFLAPVAAQSKLTYTIKNDIIVTADDNAAVRFRVDVKGNAGDNLSFAVPGLNPRNIAVKVDGKIVEASVEQAEGTQLLPYSMLVFSVPDSAGGSWKLAVDYETDSLMQRAQSGGTSLIVAAPVRSASVKSEQLQLTLPLASELPVAFGLEPDNSTIDGEQQSYSYRFNGARSSAAVLRFGSAQTNSYQLSSTLRNDGWWWRTLSLALPPDTAQQQSFLASVSPMPNNVRLDSSGNMFAEYRLAPRSTVAVEALLSLKVKPLAYDLQAATKSIDKQDYQQYLTAAGDYSGGTAVSEDSPVKLAKTLLQRATGNDQTAAELVAHARASGLPAREVVGWVAAAAQVEPIQHRWAQVYVPDVGWMVLDPALNQEFNSFGLSGAWRLTQLLVTDEATARQVAIDSVLTNATAPVAKVSFEPDAPTINSTNYVLLPGISLHRTVVRMPAGVAQDAVAVAGADKAYLLGSLAPLQTAARSELAFGGSSWSSDRQRVGTLDGDDFKELATTTISTNWLPLAGLVGLAVAVWLAVYLHARRRGQGSQHLSVHDPDDVDVREPEQLLQSDQEYPKL